MMDAFVVWMAFVCSHWGRWDSLEEVIRVVRRENWGTDCPEVRVYFWLEKASRQGFALSDRQFGYKYEKYLGIYFDVVHVNPFYLHE